jgi:DNA-binding XRE family transcriptional regulator
MAKAGSKAVPAAEGDKLMIKKSWLWDVKTSEQNARKALHGKDEVRFMMYAEMLFSRMKDPDYVFRQIDKKTFCRFWPAIRTKIKKDKWKAHMADYWDPIYKDTVREFKSRGESIHVFPVDMELSVHRIKLAQKFRQMRREAGLTQAQSARLLGVGQRFISKIETGRENLSIDTLYRIADAYLKRPEIVFK